MIFFLLPLLQSLLYLASIPVCVAFCASDEGGLKAGTGAGAFSARRAMLRARRDMAGLPAHSKRPRIPAKPLLRLLMRTRFERVRLKGRLGLSDAAATALACGGIMALGSALRARTGDVEVDVAPAFDGPRLELRGMARARIGQIIVAAAKAQFNVSGGRPHGKASH